MLVLGIATCLSLIAKADEIAFTTLPQPVQTTVIRETHIVGPTDVVRVARPTSGVYAVTVRKNPGQAVVYVNNAGEIVQPVNASAQPRSAGMASKLIRLIVLFDRVYQCPSKTSYSFF